MAMSIQLKAIYENGVFRPLQSVDLPDRQEVTVTIEGNGEPTDRVLFVLPPDRWQAFCDALDAPPRVIPALRKLLTEASVLDGIDASSAGSSPP
jgi:predicted DNA-binding antitoxin AbrB/MazE fold protein